MRLKFSIIASNCAASKLIAPSGIQTGICSREIRFLVPRPLDQPGIYCWDCPQPQKVPLCHQLGSLPKHCFHFTLEPYHKTNAYTRVHDDQKRLVLSSRMAYYYRVSLGRSKGTRIRRVCTLRTIIQLTKSLNIDPSGPGGDERKMTRRNI